MAKRKEPDTPSKTHSNSLKRARKSVDSEQVDLQTATSTIASPTKQPARNDVNGALTPKKNRVAGSRADSDAFDLSDSDATPKPNGTTLFTTPRKRGRPPKNTPTKSAKADRSAKRKSAQTLVEIGHQEDVWDNSAALAKQILDEVDNIVETTEQGTAGVEPASAPVTPSKRGRPKGAKNKRSPTPEGDLPPEERYFFQNRLGPPRVSSNVFASLGLLTHEEYFNIMRTYTDHHDLEKAYLMKLHERAFPQWRFELEQGFGVCLYGYGSKRKLITKFAEWLYRHHNLDEKPRMVVLNGHAPRINLRRVLNTIGSALVGEDEQLKLMGQPHDMVDTILTHLTDHVEGRLVLLVNSIDAAALRRISTQAILARLAAHPKVYLVASADTPTFPILWNSALKDQLRFLFHDCTTFAPYETELNPVDDVNELLGRKNRRAGGKEGVEFVLKSLTENARNLYRVLLTEILTIVNEAGDGAMEDEDAEEAGQKGGREAGGANAEEVGVEYRALYQKASEEFICSSDMNFRFLLKEFHDHQMLTSKRDGSGTELLGVPLTREEMEAILEDLVMG